MTTPNLLSNLKLLPGTMATLNLQSNRKLFLVTMPTQDLLSNLQLLLATLSTLNLPPNFQPLPTIKVPQPLCIVVHDLTKLAHLPPDPVLVS